MMSGFPNTITELYGPDAVTIVKGPEFPPRTWVISADMFDDFVKAFPPAEKKSPDSGTGASDGK